MGKSFSIYKREVQNYFLSPLAYVIMGLFLLLSGYFFSTSILSTRMATMQGAFSNMSLVLLFIVPILTMRLLAEEQARGTEELLLTHPLRLTSMVVGKYMAAVTLLVFIFVITGFYPMILFIYGSPEVGPIVSGYLGILLMGAASIAVGVFASSLTENQIIAALVSFSILLLLWVISWVANVVPFVSQTIVNSLSIISHFSDFSRGVIEVKHIIYYLSVIFVFLFLAIQNIERRRWS